MLHQITQGRYEYMWLVMINKKTFQHHVVTSAINPFYIHTYKSNVM